MPDFETEGKNGDALAPHIPFEPIESVVVRDILESDDPSSQADAQTAQRLHILFDAALRRPESVTQDSYRFGLVEPSFTVDQEGGALWKVYEKTDDPRFFTILTSSGDELFRDPETATEFEELLTQYSLAEQEGVTASDPSGLRYELGRGQEAVVYRMGRYAVREELGTKDVYAALSQLERMNAINGVIEQGLPRWLNLPPHYALHVDPAAQKTYTVMQRIDSGLTAEDLFEFPSISPKRLETIEQEIGSDDDKIKEAATEVAERYEEAYSILAGALQAAGKNPDHYLTDWKPRNVVVDKLHTPVAGSRFSLNVIDQYRA